MKKIALVLIVLLIASTSAFAIDAFVLGRVTTSTTYDLKSNEFSLNVSPLALVKINFGQDVSTEDGEGVYGSISVSNLALDYRGLNFSNWGDYTVLNSTAKDHWSEMITYDARIHFGAGYLKIDGDETIRARNSKLSNVFDDFSLIGIDNNGTFAQFGVDQAVAVGYSLEGLADVEVEYGYTAPKAATADTYDWVDTDKNPTTAPVWAVSEAGTAATKAGSAFDIALGVTAVEGLTFDVNFVMGVGGAYSGTATSGKIDATGFAVKGGYDIALGDMTVMPFVAFDATLPEGDFLFDVGGGASLTWETDKGGKLSGDSFAPMSRFFNAADQWIDAGATIAGEYVSATEAFNLKATAAYLPVENLTSAVIVEVSDIADFNFDTGVGLGAFAEYALGDIKPFVSYKYGTDISLEAGASYTGIANTTIYGYYAAPELRTDLEVGSITVGARIQAIAAGLK